MGNGQRPPGGDHHQQGPPPHGQGKRDRPGAGQPYGWQPQEQRQGLPHEGAAPAPWDARTEPPGHPAPWSARTVPSGLPPHPGAPRTGGSRRSAVVAVVAATAVVLAAGVTGFLVLGGDGGDDGKPDAGPARGAP
ncbi:hypothetical protein ACFWJY_29600, partial [Streptomyces anulatus]